MRPGEGLHVKSRESGSGGSMAVEGIAWNVNKNKIKNKSMSSRRRLRMGGSRLPRCASRPYDLSGLGLTRLEAASDFACAVCCCAHQGPWPMVDGWK